jgi:hypothetical protein
VRSHPDVKEFIFTQLRILLAIEYGKDQVDKLARSAQIAQTELDAKGHCHDERVSLKAAEKYVDAIKNLSTNEQKKCSMALR